MTKAQKKKATSVREHPRHVAVSDKNPDGVTIVDKHLRRLPGTYLDADEIEKTFKSYIKKGLVFPSKNDLAFKGRDKLYDDHIAIWTDYFNKKFNANPPLDPDVVKALIASESDFLTDPKNDKAFGIAQITKATLKILQDPAGESKNFIFNKVRQKDLKNPQIAIPMGIRWLFYKRERAQRSLKRMPSDEEVILEYKGLLKSKTDYKKSALKKFRKHYAELKKK